MFSASSRRGFRRQQRGQSVAEYAVMLVLIAIVAMMIVAGIGGGITNIFSKIGSNTEQVNRQIGD